MTVVKGQTRRHNIKVPFDNSIVQGIYDSNLGAGREYPVIDPGERRSAPMFLGMLCRPRPLQGFSTELVSWNLGHHWPLETRDRSHECSVSESPGASAEYCRVVDLVRTRLTGEGLEGVRQLTIHGILFRWALQHT